MLVLSSSEALLNMKSSLINKYISNETWRVRENSNQQFSLQGMHNFLTSTLAKEYWLTEVYPEEIVLHHKNGDYHIHDLGALSAYCCGWDLYDLLLNGFTGVEGKTQSAPPKHFRAALGQVYNFLYSVQGEVAGAVAFSSFDTLLAPFIRYDSLDEREVEQALQEFVFNMNVPTRVGFQQPFSNVTIDLQPPVTLKNRGVLISGETQEECYEEFQEEMDLFNRKLFKVLSQGDAKGRVFTFPIPTVNITKDFNWDNPNLKNFWEATAKYGLPYFSNMVNSSMSPEDVFSFCCRLQLDISELRSRGGGLFGSNPQTGSLGVVTINLPRAAYLAKGSEDKFFERILSLMDLAKESLLIKREKIEELMELGLYPYSKFYLRNVKERTGRYWDNHFNTIGVVGGHEAALNLIGKGVDTPEGKNLLVQLLEAMNSKLSEFQQETGRLFNLEATPAEGTSSRLAFIDKQELPGIITSGTEEHPYYTNSTQLPVTFEGDVFEALESQDELQSLYTSGTVFHTFVGEENIDPDAAKEYVKTVCNNYKLPYISVTPTFSVCPNHGYRGGKVEICPECEAECEVYSRVVGYIRPTKFWNDGKQVEFSEREMFEI